MYSNSFMYQSVLMVHLILYCSMKRRYFKKGEYRGMMKERPCYRPSHYYRIRETWDWYSAEEPSKANYYSNTITHFRIQVEARFLWSCSCFRRKQWKLPLCNGFPLQLMKPDCTIRSIWFCLSIAKVQKPPVVKYKGKDIKKSTTEATSEPVGMK